MFHKGSSYCTQLDLTMSLVSKKYVKFNKTVSQISVTLQSVMENSLVSFGVSPLSIDSISILHQWRPRYRDLPLSVGLWSLFIFQRHPQGANRSVPVQLVHKTIIKFIWGLSVFSFLAPYFLLCKYWPSGTLNRMVRNKIRESYIKISYQIKNSVWGPNDSSGLYSLNLFSASFVTHC